MNKGSARSILAGAVLASGLVLCAPLAAEAAVSAHVPSSADYDGIQVPSKKADLTQYGSVSDGTPVYSEPSGNSLSLLVPSTHATGVAKDQIRMAGPFTAGTSEKWVAVQVPDASHGLDSAKSNLAEAGVAYVRASNVNFGPYVTDGPTSDPSTAVGAYPSAKSDLVTTVSTDGARDLYKHPTESPDEILSTHTDKWGASRKSSVPFVYEGEKWVAVEATEGGVAYLQVTPGVSVHPANQAAPIASASPATSNPSAAAAPSVTAPSTSNEAAEAPAAENPASPIPVAEIIFKVLSVLVAALAMARTWVLINRRPVEA
jgi:hypothetical protein